MRIIVTFFLLVFNLVLESTLFQSIAIIGVKPNTALLIIVSYAMLRGDIEGALAGFFAGLLQDIFFGRYIGLHALLGMTVGFICGKPFKDFYRENYMAPLLLSALAIFGYEFAFYLTNFLLRARLDFFYYFQKIILPEAAYTVILSMPVYSLVYAVNARLEKHEKANRKLF